jgi:hypothetical protein
VDIIERRKMRKIEVFIGAIAFSLKGEIVKGVIHLFCVSPVGV